MEDTKLFSNPQEFSKFVETEASLNNMELLEFLAWYVTQNSIDESTIPPLLTPSLKSKIEREAVSQNIIKGNKTVELEF